MLIFWHFLFFNYVLKHIIFQTFKVCDNNKLQKSESKTTLKYILKSIFAPVLHLQSFENNIQTIWNWKQKQAQKLNNMY